jgi:diguanylate cyclase (GGDEF)-like protein
MVETALAFRVPTVSIMPLLLLTVALLFSNIRLSRQLRVAHAEIYHANSISTADLDELDPVTDAFLRRTWTKRAERLLHALSDPVVIFIDINNLKPVNDTFGHDAGDWLLREFADRLRTAFGPDALIGRIGGDEFAVLLNSRSDSTWHSTIEQAAAACVVNVANTAHGAAFGVARSCDLLSIREHDDNEPTIAHIMRAADLAQMRAKRRCDNEDLAVAVAFYDETSDDVVPPHLDHRPWARGRDVTHRAVDTLS